MAGTPFTRWRSSAVVVVALFAWTSCADQPLTGPATAPPDALFSHQENVDEEQAGQIQVCKHVDTGNGVAFDFTAETEDGFPGDLKEAEFTLEDGDCITIWISSAAIGSPSDPLRNVTITELVPAGWEVEKIVVNAPLLSADPEEFSGVEVVVPVNHHHGAVVTFYNILAPVVIGGEGCTPGYWRNTRLEWPIAKTTLYSDVFGVGPASTLETTVIARGGGESALLRHSTAAYLNALSGGVDYPLTAAEVVEIVQEAYAADDFEAAKDELEEHNELGCPLPNR
jgi:hypothetical protein